MKGSRTELGTVLPAPDRASCGGGGSLEKETRQSTPGGSPSPIKPAAVRAPRCLNRAGESAWENRDRRAGSERNRCAGVKILVSVCYIYIPTVQVGPCAGEGWKQQHDPLAVAVLQTRSGTLLEGESIFHWGDGAIFPAKTHFRRSLLAQMPSAFVVLLKPPCR